MEFSKKYSVQVYPDAKNRPYLELFHEDDPLTQNKSLRITQVCIHSNFEQICVCDFKGNIYLIDIANKQYWLVNNVGPPSIVDFVPKKSAILIATNCDNGNNDVHYIETETGLKIATFTGHKDVVKFLSFSDVRNQCLTASGIDAIIWDMATFCIAYALNVSEEFRIVNAKFIPASGNVLMCFLNDLVQIWDCNTCEPVKRIIPNAWKGKFLNRISISRNGRTLAMAGKCPYLLQFSLDIWQLKQIVNLSQYSIQSIRHIEFLSEPNDGGANKILVILSLSRQIWLYDCESNQMLHRLDMLSGVYKMVCSVSGKYLVTVKSYGSLNVFLTEVLLRSEEKRRKSEARADTDRTNSRIGCYFNVTVDGLKKLYGDSLTNEETFSILNLKTILREFGEFPANFRSTIWREMLQLPYNHTLFCNLVNQGCHFSCKNLPETFSGNDTINKMTRQSLQKILSCLAHWCPLFGQIPNFPCFVYRFVLVFQRCPVSCFEAIVAIITNWHQDWYLNFPYPPVQILTTIENVINHYDANLSNHFQNNQITAKSFAWQLLETGFSEVLTTADWLRFWDHVITNEPSFLVLAVVAYNLTMKWMLMDFSRVEEFEAFYCRENAFNFNRFLKRCYFLVRHVPEELHPRRFLKKFRKLPRGVYPSINYPKELIDQHDRQFIRIQDEQEKMIEEQEIILALRMEQLRKINEKITLQEEEEKLEQLKTTYLNNLRANEESLIERRNKLTELRNNLQRREVDLINNERELLKKKYSRNKSNAIERKLSSLEQMRTLREQSDNFDMLRQMEINAHDVRVAQQLLDMDRKVLDGDKTNKKKPNDGNCKCTKTVRGSETISGKIRAIDGFIRRIENEQARIQTGRENLTVQISSWPGGNGKERVDKLLESVNGLIEKFHDVK